MYRLSISDTARLIQACGEYDSRTICEVLERADSEVFAKQGGRQCISDNIYSLNSLVSNASFQSNEFVSANDLLTLRNINGEERNIKFKNAPNMIPSPSTTPNNATLLKSNMITADAINILQNFSDIVPDEVKCNVKSFVKGASGGEVTYKTSDLIAKINEGGLSGLSPAETHALTDMLSNLYETSSDFRKAIDSSSSITTTGKEVYGVIDLLKAKADKVLQGTGITIDDHAYMRMLDRDLVTVLNVNTGKHLDFEEYISLLAESAKKGKTEIEYLNSGIRFIYNPKTKTIESIM